MIIIVYLLLIKLKNWEKASHYYAIARDLVMINHTEQYERISEIIQNFEICNKNYLDQKQQEMNSKTTLEEKKKDRVVIKDIRAQNEDNKLKERLNFYKQKLDEKERAESQQAK